MVALQSEDVTYLILLYIGLGEELRGDEVGWGGYLVSDAVTFLYS